MNKVASVIKPLIPILSVAYGVAVIYVTALPVAGDNPGFAGEMLTWLITLAGIALTLFLVQYVEPKVFPDAGRFPLKLPKASVFAGLLLIAPLWLIAEGYMVYGITLLSYPVQMEPLTCTADELREDLLSSIHAVLLAPVLEELCFRQMAVSPFRRRGAQVAVCVVMAILFGLLHVRNFPGAFLSAIVYGLVFIWTRNIWCSVALHAGSNLTKTILAVYCWLGLGDMSMAKIPVIILPDIKVIFASLFFAIAGGLLTASPSSPKTVTRNKLMLKIPTKYLLLVNGLLWTAIGIKIALIGVDYYGRLESIPWWYFLLSVVVFAGFYVMFTGVVGKYAARIMAMTEPKTSVFKTFSVKGYLIIAFMITLGITLKRIPQVPDSFIAWFYCGLGPGLLSAGIRFILRWWKAIHE